MQHTYNIKVRLFYNDDLNNNTLQFYYVINKLNLFISCSTYYNNILMDLEIQGIIKSHKEQTSDSEDFKDISFEMKDKSTKDNSS